jgi:hypothetical protein
VIDEIIERTDGVPLFVEEVTKAVLEAETTAPARDRVAAIPPAPLAVPATLHASLMVRLDRLGWAKEVAQIGAAKRPMSDSRAWEDRTTPVAGASMRKAACSNTAGSSPVMAASTPKDKGRSRTQSNPSDRGTRPRKVSRFTSASASS